MSIYVSRSLSFVSSCDLRYVFRLSINLSLESCDKCTAIFKNMLKANNNAGKGRDLFSILKRYIDIDNFYYCSIDVRRNYITTNLCRSVNFYSQYYFSHLAIYLILLNKTLAIIWKCRITIDCSTFSRILIVLMIFNKV